MRSFEFSLAELNLHISPMDQLFIARIQRRDTWDIHYYSGILFALALACMFAYTIVKKQKKDLNIVILFTMGLILISTGLIMELRLHTEITDYIFSVLKDIHNFSKWSFLTFMVAHGLKLSNKVSLGLLLASSVLIGPTVYAKQIDNDRTKWLKDINYIEGSLYLE